MKHFFKIFFTSMFLASYVANAQEVVSVEGQYSYGPDISDTIACERAKMSAKNEAVRRVSGENISNDTIEDCVQADCILFEKTWLNEFFRHRSSFSSRLLLMPMASTP